MKTQNVPKLNSESATPIDEQSQKSERDRSMKSGGHSGQGSRQSSQMRLFQVQGEKENMRDRSSS